MLKYIIRLDDACPQMDEKKWNKIENLLDKYNIKPIVGIIPDNRDKEFNNEKIENFWEKYAKKWQEKHWIIAQHGLNHDLSETIRTEFKGKSLIEQLEILKKGYEILESKGICVDCFFAPAHTFDKNTVKACNKLKFYKFISDGCAFYPYKKNDVLFIPCVFDTPHKISSKGIFTFVYHPNKMVEKDLEYLENFIVTHRENFEIDIDDIIEQYKYRKRNVKDVFLQMLIFGYRTLRRIIRR